MKIQWKSHRWPLCCVILDDILLLLGHNNKLPAWLLVVALVIRVAGLAWLYGSVIRKRDLAAARCLTWINGIVSAGVLLLVSFPELYTISTALMVLCGILYLCAIPFVPAFSPLIQLLPALNGFLPFLVLCKPILVTLIFGVSLIRMRKRL